MKYRDRISDTQWDDYANPRLEVGGLRLEVGSLRFEVRSWRLEVGSWKLEVGSWRLERRRQNALKGQFNSAQWQRPG